MSLYPCTRLHEGHCRSRLHMCGRNSLARADPFGIPLIPPEVMKTRLGGLLYILCWAFLVAYSAVLVNEYAHPILHKDTSYIPSDTLVNRAKLVGAGAFEHLPHLFVPFDGAEIPSVCSNAANASDLPDSDPVICSKSYGRARSCVGDRQTLLHSGSSFAFAASSSRQLALSSLQVRSPHVYVFIIINEFAQAVIGSCNPAISLDRHTPSPVWPCSNYDAASAVLDSLPLSKYVMMLVVCVCVDNFPVQQVYVPVARAWRVCVCVRACACLYVCVCVRVCMTLYVC